MNPETKERIKDISIKLLLTIPAVIIGLVAAVLTILKPAITLWSLEK